MNLLKYIGIRILGLFAQLSGAIALVFAMVRFIPYDPTIFFLFGYNGPDREQRLAALRSSLGIDRPIYVQYYEFMKNLILEGSFGDSWTRPEPVSDLIFYSMQYTVLIFGLGFIVYTTIAMTLGIYSGIHRGNFGDNLSRIITTATYSIPSYVMGLLLILISVYFNLQIAPWPDARPDNMLEFMKFTILPILTIVFVYTGFQFRLVRVHILGIMKQNYIRTARAKGLHEQQVIFKHALRNAYSFLITTIAVTFPIAFSGVAAIEVVFTIPGIGQLMVYAANQFDWPILIGTTAVFTIINGVVLTFVDILNFYLNPRLREGATTIRF